jgi:hypothetical protein
MYLILPEGYRSTYDGLSDEEWVMRVTLYRLHISRIVEGDSPDSTDCVESK